MNNSFHRVIDGMIEALRVEVLPHLDGDFARGEAFGVIFLLKTLRLRATWSSTFLAGLLSNIEALREELGAIPGLPTSAPRIEATAHDGNPKSMEIARDRGNQSVCALIDWAADPSTAVSEDTRRRVTAAVNAYIKRQLHHEMSASARPMFAEMSLGREIVNAEGIS